MRIHHELSYDEPPDRVYAMLSTPAFREAVCGRLRVLRSTVEITPHGVGMKAVIDQVQPATGVPSFAKRFVGDEITIRQQESWSSPAGADLEVTIPGKPGSMLGSITLAAVGAGSRQTVDADVTVPLPLIGSKLERMIADMLHRSLDAENTVGRDWLAERP
ncbi:MAG TPA: DUF2505 domain-containing protein [Nocardioidaceae bacterium]|nr:DUF2505 domain-containing protein [Nocardioidaceae bacterium]